MNSIAIQLSASTTVTTLQSGYSQALAAPQTASEHILAEIWCRVLNIPQVSIHHNFFDLGGDALQCLQVQCMAQARGVHFSHQKLYQHPTIYELIRHCLCN